MVQFSKEDINRMHHLYRINLINSCTGFKSANLIGTEDKNGKSNVAVFSSVTHMGSNPGLIGFFTRPTSVIRHTYENIKETGCFTINQIHKSIIKDAHHTSAKYAKSVSEFDVTGLEKVYKEKFFAPFVKDCKVQVALSFVEDYLIKANNTILVIGKIEKLFVDDTILEKDGFINLSKAETATINGLDAYAVPDSHTRLAYQRPKEGFAKREN